VLKLLETVPKPVHPSSPLTVAGAQRLILAPFRASEGETVTVDFAADMIAVALWLGGAITADNYSILKALIKQVKAMSSDRRKEFVLEAQQIRSALTIEEEAPRPIAAGARN
jgi:hypothetical protein